MASLGRFGAGPLGPIVTQDPGGSLRSCRGFLMSGNGRRRDRSGSMRAERLEGVVPPGGGVRLVSDALMFEVAAGDRDAFESLYLLLAPGVFRVALSVVGDRVKAEDVTGGVFAALWTQAPSFDGSRGSVRVWAMTTAHRIAHEVAQRERTRDVMAASTVPVAAESHVATDSQRLAIALAHFGGLSHTEIARLLGLPAPTVTTRIRDGLRQMAGTG